MMKVVIALAESDDGKKNVVPGGRVRQYDAPKRDGVDRERGVCTTAGRSNQRVADRIRRARAISIGTTAAITTASGM
jgi:hypothetical protein